MHHKQYYNILTRFSCNADVVFLKKGFLYTLSFDYAKYIGSKAGQTGYPVCYAEDVNNGWILQELNATVTKDAVCVCCECSMFLYDECMSVGGVCLCITVKKLLTLPKSFKLYFANIIFCHASTVLLIFIMILYILTFLLSLVAGALDAQVPEGHARAARGQGRR